MLSLHSISVYTTLTHAGWVATYQTSRCLDYKEAMMSCSMRQSDNIAPSILCTCRDDVTVDGHFQVFVSTKGLKIIYTR